MRKKEFLVYFQWLLNFLDQFGRSITQWWQPQRCPSLWCRGQCLDTRNGIIECYFSNVIIDNEYTSNKICVLSSRCRCVRLGIFLPCFCPSSHSHPIHQLFLKRPSVSWWEWTACTIRLPYIGRDMKRRNINADSMRLGDESHASITGSPCF